jgi:hypothetical protein
MRVYDTFLIPTHFLPAIVNSDSSGLTDEEDELLEDFCKNKPNLTLTEEEDEQFCHRNDITGYIGGTCKECFVTWDEPGEDKSTDDTTFAEGLAFQGFEGIDASATESLYVYRLMWKELPDEVRFWYKANDEASVQSASLYKSYIDGLNDCLLTDSLLSYLGTTREEWLEKSHAERLFDLFTYHGAANVFGD